MLGNPWARGHRASAQPPRRVAVSVAGLLFCLLGAAGGPAQQTASAGEPESSRAQRQRDRQAITAEVQALPLRYQEWLRTVAGLLSQGELDYFLDLRSDYQRDAFMEKFWDPRDPDPLTPVNELRQRWEEYQRQAGGLPFGDPRFVLFLLNGPPGRWSLPDGRAVARCFSKTKELEIWFYDGSERTPRRFPVVFQKRGAEAPYEVVRPGTMLRPMQRRGGLPTTDIRLLCADELLRYAFAEMDRVAAYYDLLEEVLTPPLPSAEWLATLKAGGTDLPTGAKVFQVEAGLSFPARKQSRTALQVVVRVPVEEAPGRVFDGERFHNFLVLGEVIRDDRLFESFRYRFEGPTAEGATVIPLGFTRYLRRGTVTLRLLVEDVFGQQYSQIVTEVDIPSPEGRPPVAPQIASADAGATAGPSLRIIVPPGNTHSGMVRFQTRVEGEFDRVRFFLDDQEVLSKRRPPYSVELDLGSAPAPHRVRIVGLVDDREVATDQVWLNQGAMRFRVRMIEPRSGGIYPGSLTARVAVDTPDGRPPQRVELFVDDELVATLEEGPYEEAIRLTGAAAAVVRAVAYLADGSAAEDAVLVNTSGFVQEVAVQLVELYALVTDGDGEPVGGLQQDRFTVYEDDAVQSVQRFEETRQAPISAALLIDRSASMQPHLAAVRDAALTFAGGLQGEDDGSNEDRIALFSFADDASLDAGFGSSLVDVERVLAGLRADGGTALYDSLGMALNTFEGVPGETALVLFSDGQDEGSRLTHELALETARRAGVTLYAIGIAAAFPDRRSRRLLEELAEETGGRAIFVDDLDQLAAVYDRILAELRARYLLVYPSPGGKPASQYRQVRVEVEGRGLEVRSRRGYYP